MDAAPNIAMRLSPVVETKLASGELGAVEGYAAVWGGPPDSYGDVMVLGAFKRTLAEHKAEGISPAFLWSHDLSRPVGKIMDLVEDTRGLRMKAVLNRETQAGAEAYAHAKAGSVTGLSFGYNVPPSGRKRLKDGTAQLVDVTLYEVSMVALPANRRARLTSVKSFSSRRDFEQSLTEAFGLPSSAARKIAAVGYAGLAGAEEEHETKQIADMLRASALKWKGF